MKDASLDRQPKIQSFLVREILRWILLQTNNNCRSQITILTNSPRQLRLLAGRYIARPRYVLVHNFLRKLCNGSKKWRWLIQWMILNFRHLLVVFNAKFLKYLMRGLLQHWTESSIIQNSKEESVWKNKKALKQDRFRRGRQIAFLIYEYFRVTGANVSVENFSDLFTKASSKWWYSGIRFRMGRTFIFNDKIPIWWHLGRIVQFRNESEKIHDHIVIVCPGDSSVESSTWLSQIEDDGVKKYRAEFTKYFWSQTRKSWKKRRWSRNQETKQREQEFLEIVGNEKPTGSVLKKTLAGFRPDINTRAKKWNNRIRLRVLSCSRMREMRASRTQTFVTNLNNNEQETSEMQFRRICVWDWMRVIFASRSKAKAKPRRREPAGSFPRTVPTGKRTWTDVEPGEYSLSEFEVSKKLIRLLRHANPTSRKWWSHWILEKQRQSSETVLVSSSSVWRQVEEKHGRRRRRRKQENIPCRMCNQFAFYH